MSCWQIGWVTIVINSHMNILDKPIVSREVSQRTHEEFKLKKTQQKQMGDRLMEKPSDAWRQTLNASGDTYIASALKKVRQSKVTHDETLTRMSGTWLFNETLNASEDK